LEVHPDKTRIIEFGRFALENRRARGQGKPETFAFLGLTHIFGRTREGRRLIRRHTVRERLNAKLRQVKTNLCRMRHLPIPEQGALPAAGAERLPDGCREVGQRDKIRPVPSSEVAICCGSGRGRSPKPACMLEAFRRTTPGRMIFMRRRSPPLLVPVTWRLADHQFLARACESPLPRSYAARR
jgi:hypothetical protein